jgi:cupin 2 domain-containing protein
MAEAQLAAFLEKVHQLNAFVALSEQRPELRQALRDCAHHHQVVELAHAYGFEIGRRWGDQDPPLAPQQGSNLLGSACPPPGEERVRVLINGPQLRLEQIHSCQAASPQDSWYDQTEHEWVLILQGSARLRFEDEAEDRELNRGDGLPIDAHRRHRVVATDPAPGTIWLALFWPSP